MNDIYVTEIIDPSVLSHQQNYPINDDTNLLLSFTQHVHLKIGL